MIGIPTEQNNDVCANSHGHMTRHMWAFNQAVHAWTVLVQLALLLQYQGISIWMQCILTGLTCVLVTMLAQSWFLYSMWRESSLGLFLSIPIYLYQSTWHWMWQMGLLRFIGIVTILGPVSTFMYVANYNNNGAVQTSLELLHILLTHLCCIVLVLLPQCPRETSCSFPTANHVIVEIFCNRAKGNNLIQLSQWSSMVRSEVCI